ncbi:MAG: hypothetical protein KDH08_18320, partial [Anaerolineae bacterium]|nr:hypothetical protein [Anaerolineae bacterium]
GLLAVLSRLAAALIDAPFAEQFGKVAACNGRVMSLREVAGNQPTCDFDCHLPEATVFGGQH